MKRIQPITQADIKRRYKEDNPEGHFFDKETMECFDSKIHGGAKLWDGNVIFITSEQITFSDQTRGEREYSVRTMIRNQPGVRTVDKNSKSLDEAKKALGRYLEKATA